MSVKKHGYHLEGLMALLLFGVFAVCLLIVLLTGADSYQGLTQRDRASDNRRVCAQYLTTRVRQADAAGAVTAGQFGGGDALLLTQDIDGEAYVTRIYVSGGYLMELFSAADSELSPEDGEKLMAAQALSASLSGGMLELSVTPEDGRPVELTLSLRSGEGGVS